MDFIKKNLIMVISAAVAVLAIVLIVLGMMKIGSVKEDFSAVNSQLTTIEDLSRGVSVELEDGKRMNLIPTEKIVEKIKGLSAQSKAQGYKLLERSLKENIGYNPQTSEIKRKILVDGIFPTPISDAQPWKFRNEYRKAIDDLLKTMQAGPVPSEKEIAEEEENVAQDLGFLMDDIGGGAKTTRRAAMTQSQDDLKIWAVVSAAKKRADEIKVYCNQSNLDIIGEVYTSTGGTPPTVESMWWAQLSLWLQQDIAHAVAEANREAKNVTQSVVKRITNLGLMHGYLLKDGYIGREQSQLPESFTGMVSSDHYNVLRFSITCVVDASRIPQFIDAMYKQGHYVLYSWSIADIQDIAADKNVSSYGGMKLNNLYDYGTAPVVELTTYWETYLLSDFYHWGIVGYDLNKETNKPVLVMYDGKRVEVESIEKRDNLKGLMPKMIRAALSGEDMQRR